MELDACRSDGPAGAGASEQSPDGLGAGTGGVGVGVETSRGEVVGRGVLVGEGVDRGEGGLCCGARRRGSVSALLQAQVSVFRGPAASGGTRVAGADVFSARCLRLPLGVSSTGAGGWVESAFRPRGRRRSAGGRLAAEVAIGSIIRSDEQSWQAGSRGAAVSGVPRGC